MKTPSRLTAAAACALLAFTVSACGSSSNDPRTPTREAGDLQATPAAQVTATPGADAKVIEITLDGTTVSPSQERVKVSLGQPVVLKIDAKQAGQLHVHSDPEHKIDFDAGTSEITLTFDLPGIIDVEDHALDALIVQLEVS